MIWNEPKFIPNKHGFEFKGMLHNYDVVDCIVLFDIEKQTYRAYKRLSSGEIVPCYKELKKWGNK